MEFGFFAQGVAEDAQKREFAAHCGQGGFVQLKLR
jgi:hypothetical protein